MEKGSLENHLFRSTYSLKQTITLKLSFIYFLPWHSRLHHSLELYIHPAILKMSESATVLGHKGRESFKHSVGWEVNSLGQIHHPNLVKLIGYCSEGDNRLLVCKFMPEGSLKNHLSKRLNPTLSWETRINIAIGVATGLSFLHDRASQLIHGDVKASSILLDGDFGAKLSGSTSAKHRPPGNLGPPPGYWILPPHNCRPGPDYWSPTRGYWSKPPDGYRTSIQIMDPSRCTAPEYIVTGKLIAKCEVYSFGVVLIALLCGCCGSDPERFHGEQDLVKWARLYLGARQKLFQIMDTKLEGQYHKKGAYTVATLALQCLSADPKCRPRMAEVLGTLEQLQGPKTGI